MTFTRRITRALLACVAIGTATVFGAGPASAATIVYQAGTPIQPVYTCVFPGISAQPATFAARFDAPDTVPTASTVTLSNLAGTMSFSATFRTLFAAWGYDGVRGRMNLGLSAVGGTLSAPVATNLTIPSAIYPRGAAMVIPFAQDTGSVVPTLTLTGPGAAVLSLGGTMSAPLELHKTDTTTWTPFTVNCTLKVTSPPQNRAFSPPFGLD